MTDLVNFILRALTDFEKTLFKTILRITTSYLDMKIEREKGLDSLSEPLRQMAEIRMENPDLSLNELAKMFDPPISRSGVNHRLSRLVKIAEEI